MTKNDKIKKDIIITIKYRKVKITLLSNALKEEINIYKGENFTKDVITVINKEYVDELYYDEQCTIKYKGEQIFEDETLYFKRKSAIVEVYGKNNREILNVYLGDIINHNQITVVNDNYIEELYYDRDYTIKYNEEEIEGDTTLYVKLKTVKVKIVSNDKTEEIVMEIGTPLKSLLIPIESKKELYYDKEFTKKYKNEIIEEDIILYEKIQNVYQLASDEDVKNINEIIEIEKASVGINYTFEKHIKFLDLEEADFYKALIKNENKYVLCGYTNEFFSSRFSPFPVDTIVWLKYDSMDEIENTYCDMPLVCTYVVFDILIEESIKTGKVYNETFKYYQNTLYKSTWASTNVDEPRYEKMLMWTWDKNIEENKDTYFLLYPILSYNNEYQIIVENEIEYLVFDVESTSAEEIKEDPFIKAEFGEYYDKIIEYLEYDEALQELKFFGYDEVTGEPLNGVLNKAKIDLKIILELLKE